MEDHSSIQKWQCELQNADAVNAGRKFVDLEGLDETMLESLGSGTSTLFSESAVITNDGKLKVPKGASTTIEKAEKRGPAAKGKGKQGKGKAPKDKRNLAPQQVDARKVLAVRIIANDSSTTSSVTQIGDEIFGNNGDVVNLRERFQACSYGELLMEPFSGTLSNGQSIAGGVVEISVNINVNGADDGVVVDSTVAALESVYGDLPSQFDHVMLCIPPGTAGGWIAYGKEPLFFCFLRFH